MQRVIADTGFFVAIGRRLDAHHARAVRFAERFEGQLVTSSPIIVEACHFLSTEWRLNLLRAAGSERLKVAEVPVASYPDLALTIKKCSNRDIDFADASLVWLADQIGLRQILTVDVGDFSTLRLRGGKRFELIDWF